MRIENIDHVFFDLDHTLWDFDKNSALTFEKIFQMNKLSINLDEFLEIYIPLNLQYWKMYREERIDKESLRFRRLDDVFKQLKIKVKTRMIYKLSEDYIANLISFNHLFEGTIEILDYLKPKYKMHIITNGFKEVQRGKLNSAKIDHFFETVTNSEMVGVKKPNPRIFTHALNKARAKVENSIMIGDNYEADILGALNLGFEAICFNYHNDEPVENIKYIDNLMELKHYL